jgi:hypothetical protein
MFIFGRLTFHTTNQLLVKICCASRTSQVLHDSKSMDSKSDDFWNVSRKVISVVQHALKMIDCRHVNCFPPVTIAACSGELLRFCDGNCIYIEVGCLQIS